MKITFTERIVTQNKVMVITSWDKDQWCGVVGLKPEDQTLENIRKVKQKMAERARLPDAPRNGVRRAIKC